MNLRLNRHKRVQLGLSKVAGWAGHHNAKELLLQTPCSYALSANFAEACCFDFILQLLLRFGGDCCKPIESDVH